MTAPRLYRSPRCRASSDDNCERLAGETQEVPLPRTDCSVGLEQAGAVSGGNAAAGAPDKARGKTPTKSDSEKKNKTRRRYRMGTTRFILQNCLAIRPARPRIPSRFPVITGGLPANKAEGKADSRDLTINTCRRRGHSSTDTCIVSMMSSEAASRNEKSLMQRTRDSMRWTPPRHTGAPPLTPGRTHRNDPAKTACGRQAHFRAGRFRGRAPRGYRRRRGLHARRLLCEL